MANVLIFSHFLLNLSLILLTDYTMLMMSKIMISGRPYWMAEMSKNRVTECLEKCAIRALGGGRGGG